MELVLFLRQYGLNSIVNVNEYVEDVDVNYNYKSDKVMFTIGWNF